MHDDETFDEHVDELSADRDAEFAEYQSTIEDELLLSMSSPRV